MAADTSDAALAATPLVALLDEERASNDFGTLSSNNGDNGEPLRPLPPALRRYRMPSSGVRYGHLASRTGEGLAMGCASFRDSRADLCRVWSTLSSTPTGAGAAPSGV